MWSAASTEKRRAVEGCSRMAYAGACRHGSLPWRFAGPRWDRFQCRRGGTCGAWSDTRAGGDQTPATRQRRRRARALVLGLLFGFGDGGGTSTSFSVGLSLGRYDSPSMTKS